MYKRKNIAVRTKEMQQCWQKKWNSTDKGNTAVLTKEIQQYWQNKYSSADKRNIIIYFKKRISYCKFCIHKVFTFWFVIYNFKQHQIGGNLRKFEEKLRKLRCFLFKKGRGCSPSSVLWSSLSKNQILIKVWRKMPNFYCSLS